MQNSFKKLILIATISLCAGFTRAETIEQFETNLRVMCAKFALEERFFFLTKILSTLTKAKKESPTQYNPDSFLCHEDTKELCSKTELVERINVIKKILKLLIGTQEASKECFNRRSTKKTYF